MKAAMLTTAALVVSATLSAQFSSRVEAVRVDALVTADGRPVTGLTTEDFELRDNGVVQNVRLLGSGSSAVDVILALDMSASLTPARLASLRGASTALLARLRPDDRAALLTFNHAVTRRQALTRDIHRVAAALNEVAPSGSTSLIDGIFAALAMAEPGDHRTLLIIFSDGLDTSSWLPPAAAVESAQRADVVIYAVSAADEAPQMLKNIAQATGGSVLDVAARGLGTAFVRILDEFRQRYLLSYTPASSPAPGWHRIEVKVKTRRASVKARSGYMVPGSGE